MLKVLIKQSWEGMGVDVLIYEKSEDGGKMRVWEFGTPTIKEVENGFVKTPSFYINNGDEFLTALAVALDKKGVKLPERSFAEGELVATKLHLEDMRAIVKKCAKPLSFVVPKAAL